MGTLAGRRIVLGVTGGIAAYKAAELASRLKKAGAAVHVVMTHAATSFVTPLTFRTITDASPVITSSILRWLSWPKSCLLRLQQRTLLQRPRQGLPTICSQRRSSQRVRRCFSRLQ